MILGPDPRGSIWISSRAAVKLVQISRGRSGGRLGAWNRGGQRWTDYNTLPLILSYVWANARLDFEPDWSSHSVAFPGTQAGWAGDPRRVCEDPDSPPHPSSVLKVKSSMPVSLQSLVLNHSQEVLSKHPAHGWKYQCAAKHAPQARSVSEEAWQNQETFSVIFHL